MMEIQHGTLNLVLRVGRVFGVAPIYFNDNGITMSKRIYWYSKLLNVILAFLMMTAYAMDLQHAQTKQAFKTQSSLKIIISIPLFILSLWTTYCGAFDAPKRMRVMMRCIKQAELIKLDLKFNGISKGSEKKRKIFFITIILVLCVLTLYDFTITLMSGVYFGRNLTIQYLYSALYIHYIFLQMLIMQFVFVVVTVNDLLGALAFRLENILKQVCMQERYPLHSLRTGSETIHRLSQSYNDICGVMRQIEEAHGSLILLIFIILFLKLVFTPFKLILSFRSEWPPDLVLQFLWCIYSTILAVTIIEPCHQTYLQTQRTHVAVSELICRLDHLNPMAPALSKFFQQLLLNKVSYTLASVAILGRPFLASMFGSVTTYLVIMIQFQSI